MLQGRPGRRQGGYLGLGGLGLFLLALGQQAARSAWKGSCAGCAGRPACWAGFPVFLGPGLPPRPPGQLLILELFANVFLDPLGVVAQQIDVSMVTYPPLCFFPVSPGKKKKPPVPAWGRWTRVATRLAASRRTRPLMRRKGAPPADSSPAPGGMEPPFRPPPRTIRRLSYASKTDCFPLLRELCTPDIIHPPAHLWQGGKAPNPPRLKKTEAAVSPAAPSCRLSLYLPSRISLRMSSTRAAMLGVVFRFFSTVLQA